MRFDEVRRLLALVEELDWFEEQGYGTHDTWVAVRRVQEVCVDNAADLISDTQIHPLPTSIIP